MMQERVSSLSQQQRRTWLLTRVPGQVFWVQVGYWLHGKLDQERWHRALQTCVERDEIWRMIFAENEAPALLEPLTTARQVLTASACLSWVAVDMRGFAQGEQEIVIQERTEGERLALGAQSHSPLRCCLFQSTDDCTLCLLTAQALYADGETLQVLLQNVFHLYHGQETEEDLESIPYGHYVEWQNWLLTGEERQEGEQFWRAYLQHAPIMPTPFPLGIREGERQSQRITGPSSPLARQGYVLTRELFSKLSALAEQRHTTLKSILLACWCDVLQTYQPTKPLLLGLCTNGRVDAELRRVLGPCGRTVPLLYNASTALSDQIEVINEQMELVTAWEDYFPLVREQSPVASSFPLQFEYIQVKPELSGLDLRCEMKHCITWDDYIIVKLVCLECSDSVQLEWYYNSQICPPEALTCVVRSLVTCLERLADDPTLSQRLLYAPSEAEHTALLATEEGPTLLLQDCSSIHQLFEQHVDCYPDRIALHCEDLQLTYALLDQYANRQAQALLRQGIKAETRIALLFDEDQGAEALISLLGILKAGGVYVPLHTGWSYERLNMLLTASHCQLILTQKSAREVQIWCSVPCLQYAEGLTFPEIRPAVVTDPRQLAYIAYTSGSTGKPKGIGVEHRQVLNYTQAILRRLEVTEPLSFARVSSLATDLGNTAIFGALGSGGCLHNIGRERSTHPAAFEEYMSSRAIECLKITPTHLASLFLPLGSRTMLPGRFLLLGGEALPWSLIDRLHASGARCEIINHYGPTETTIGCLTYTTSEERLHYGLQVPPGYPLANMEVLVLDENMEPQPVGRPGELYIGGAGVSRGYLDNPEATAQQFLPHPYAKRAGSRLYKTGDQGRLLPDGSIEFLGRHDFQVKVHGYRLELAEIEHAIAQHPAIQEAIARVYQPELDDPTRIIAYVRPKEILQPLNADEVLQSARQLLPSYAVPGELVVMQNWPLLANGKLDHAALPIPAWGQSRQQIVSPRTPLEKLLIELCREVLKRADISVTDNFFSLGGDSITGIKLVARANQQGIHLTPKQLFEYQTIEALASIAEVSQEEPTWEPVSGEVPFTPLQQQFLDAAGERVFDYYDLLCIELTEDFSPQAALPAIQAVINHHDMLRLQLQRDEQGAWRQVIEIAPAVDQLQLKDLSHLPSVEQQQALEDLQLDLLRPASNTSALFSLLLVLRGSHGPDLLYIRWHYIVADAFSMHILLEDLAHAYQQARQEGPITLPAKTTSLKKWSESLSAYADSDEIQRSLSYWLRLASPSFALVQQPDEGQREVTSCALGQEETRDLLQNLSRTISLDDVLLAALTLALCIRQGTTSIKIDLDRHGREGGLSGMHTERTVGRLAYRFPMQLQLPQGADEDLPQSIAAQRRLVPDQGLSYGLLRYRCSDPQVRQKMQQIPPSLFAYNNVGSLTMPDSDTLLFQQVRVESQQENVPFPYRLRLIAFMQDKQLHFFWQTDSTWIEHDELLALQQEFLRLIHSLTTRLGESREHAPALTVGLHFNQEEFDDIIDQYGSYDGGES